MKLNELSFESKDKKRIRVGRGIGSGSGKTCRRGHKGQKSRSGVAIKGFEGGQMPIYQLVPKRGFNNIFRVEFQTLNIGDIQRFVDAKRIDPKKAIDKQLLLDLGILRKKELPFKVLGKGKLKSTVNVEADAASSSAIKAIEKAGGKISLPAS